MIVLFRAALALLLTLQALFVFGCGNRLSSNAGISYAEQKGEEMSGKVIKSDEEWRQICRCLFYL